MKCLQYWPLKVGDVAVFGSFRVTLKSKETWSDFETNQLLLTKVCQHEPHMNYKE